MLAANWGSGTWVVIMAEYLYGAVGAPRASPREVGRRVIQTVSLYQICKRLFNDYPLAVRAADGNGSSRSMVLMAGEGDDVEFCVLSHDCSDSELPYSVRPWPSGREVHITPKGGIDIPEAVAGALINGIPLPRHGSVFGWTENGTITALVVFYTEYDPARTLPRWSVMPMAGMPESRWPPFIGERVFGKWFWGYCQNRATAPLDGLIARNPDAVFWVDARATIGSDCCVVARDLARPEHYLLPRGRYIYSETLRSGQPLPSFRELLAYSGKVDLSTRFPAFPPHCRPGHENGRTAGQCLDYS